MRKALIFGLTFGIVFGFFDMITIGTGLSLLGFVFGFLSLIAYIALLILVIRDSAKKGKSYGQRFLTGFVFSLVIGLSYGLISGIAGIIFAQNLAEAAGEAVNELESLGIDTAFFEEGNVTEPTPIWNFFSAFLGAIIFNTIFGAMFSAIFAAFFKKSEEMNNSFQTPQTNQTNPQIIETTITPPTSSQDNTPSTAEKDNNTQSNSTETPSPENTNQNPQI